MVALWWGFQLEDFFFFKFINFADLLMYHELERNTEEGLLNAKDKTFLSFLMLCRMDMAAT